MKYREIYPDGTEFSVDRDEPFTLEELYDILNCDTVQVLHIEHNVIMIMDENAALNDEPVNDEATKIANQTIRGAVLIADERLMQ